MPITSSISLSSYSSVTGIGTFNSRFRGKTQIGTFQTIEEAVVNNLSAYASFEAPDSFFTVIVDSNSLKYNISALASYEPTKILNIQVQDFTESIANLSLRAVVGDLHPSENPNKVILSLIGSQHFNSIINNINVLGYSKYHSEVGTFLATATGGFVTTISAVAEDVSGPRLFNIIPSSGSTYNNPFAGISFDLKDQELTSINNTSVSFYVNGIQVVNSGLAISPSGIGLTTFTQVSPSFYQFTFTPSGTFNLGSFVTVSGQARDTTAPSGNLSLFNYNYKVWDQGNLGATILGLPDSQSPFISFITPTHLQTQVGFDTNIQIDIVDEHTGLDYNSVNITIEDEVVISAGALINNDYALSITNISGGRGRSYLINPDNLFGPQEVINIEVGASDLYVPAPNYLTYSSSFLTLTNSHLSISGLQIEIDAVYTDLNLLQSYTTVTGSNNFKTKFYNFNGLGISASGSYINLNGQTLSGVSIVPVISGIEYDIFFQLTPNYLTDADLQFHVVQETLVSGNTVYRDFYSELLWGAEYCYDPDNNLTYDTDITVAIKVSDVGDTQEDTKMVTSFKTVSMPKNNLSAEITGIDLITGNLIANLTSNNPFYEYGKTMNLVLEVSDFAGNKLIYPYKFNISNN